MIKLICTQGKNKRVIDITEYTVKEVKEFAQFMVDSGYDIILKRIEK